MDEVKTTKKLTATSVMKKFNLNPEELDTLLEQIFRALEDENEDKEEDE